MATAGARLGRGGRSRLLIYPLSLAIYCTSWTFFGSVGLASRTGFDFLTIYLGPMLMIGLVLPADHAHRAARQGAEHHLDRRLHRRALRQEPGGRGDRRADRDRRHDPLHRAAAQSGVVVARAPSWCTSAARAAPCSRCSATSRCSSRCRWRRSRCCSAPATSTPPSTRTADAGDRDRIDGQAGRLPRRRHLRDLLHVRRAVGAVRRALRARRRPPRCSRASRTFGTLAAR